MTPAAGATAPATDASTWTSTWRMDLPADLVGLLYQARWQIETFVRTFKHVLGCRHLLHHSQNGIAQVKADNNGEPGTVIATYRYDGLNRRIEKLLGADPEDPDTAYGYYYNTAWRVLEVRKGGDPDPLSRRNSRNRRGGRRVHIGREAFAPQAVGSVRERRTPCDTSRFWPWSPRWPCRSVLPRRPSAPTAWW
ncbi:MAG TPA: transposase [Phycisphaerae bacterium]|nr:transposase [Phycisphaerae bacterium]